jgi:membrane protein DedA with SNARE-associated domain
MFELATIVKHSPYAGVFLLLVLGDIGFPVPEDATLLLGGFLIAHGVTKAVPMVAVIYMGLLVTDSFLYWMGRKYGRKIVEHKRFRRILSPEKLLLLEEKFRRWGVFVVFVGRHFLGVRAQVFLVAGIMRMPAIKFVMADGASAVLTVSLMVGMGYLGGNSLQVLKQDVTRVEHLMVVALIILILFGVASGLIRGKIFGAKRR